MSPRVKLLVSVFPLLLPILHSIPAVAGEPEIAFLRGSLAGSGFETEFPTALAFGPDGRLYVCDQEGRIQALTLDSKGLAVTAVQQVTEDDDVQEIYGIAFDPTDASSPPPIYISNTVSGFGINGSAPAGEFAGKITKIDGPGYANRIDVISGLPVSNSSHQTNGIAFDSSGVLYMAQGSTTNAGVPNDSGGSFLSLPEVPLSSAFLMADISAPGFDGAITHNPPNTYSHTVDQTSGDVVACAFGLRNPYDFTFHSNGKIYLTDNGPNAPFGKASLDCSTDSVDGPAGPDELNIIVLGDYYGHANRNRGRFDSRQCEFHLSSEPTTVDYTAPIATLPSSSDGILEYGANGFGGALAGDLIYGAFNDGTIRRIVLSGDGNSVISDTVIASGFNGPLDLVEGSDGTLYIAEFTGSQIAFLRPQNCREGTVNSAACPVTDVLFVNGIAGTGPTREVQLATNDPIKISMVSPPSRAGQRTRFCVWASVGVPNPNTIAELPMGLGYTCMPNELSGGASNRRYNSLGFEGLLGADDWPGPSAQPAPIDLLCNNAGVGFAVSFYIQGLILDPFAHHGQAAVTNGILIRVE